MYIAGILKFFANKMYNTDNRRLEVFFKYNFMTEGLIMDKIYNFNEIINRRNTNSVKWDYMDVKYGRNDLIHLGVADMDFRSPKPIIDSLQKVLDFGIFGYTGLDESFYTSIQRWIKKQLGISIPRDWIVYCPKVNMATSICVETFTGPDSKVMINTPTYAPIREAVVKNNRRLEEIPLIIKNGRFTMNFDYMERAVDKDTRMYIISNPDNPSTRAWSSEELERLADFCLKNDMILYSDEIHSDILAEGVQFRSVLSMNQDIYDRLIYSSSLTKTFNIPGIVISYMIIPNKGLRDKVKKTLNRLTFTEPNIFALAAIKAAYNYCDDWLKEVKEYINENEKFFRSFVIENMKEFKVMPREGTYLLWVDYSALKISESDLCKWFINDAGVEVQMGSGFGKGGNGYFRVNIATPRKVLEQALINMKNAYYKLIK